MSQLLGLLAPIGLGAARKGDDDDLIDRLHHTYTVMILILISVIVSTNQYVGEAIHCWVPGHFTGNHGEYANKACWVSNTYYLPIDETIPKAGEGNREWINYYQWLPMILLTQAALFYVPYLIWRGFNGKIGVRIHNIVDAGTKLHDGENKAKNLTYMVKLMDRYLGFYRDETRGCCTRLKYLFKQCNLVCGKKHGNFTAVLYISCKMLYLINCVGQLFIMDLFLGTDFHFYGFRALSALTGQEKWPGSSRFPTFTICDYEVRQMGDNIHRNTVQCVLPINFYNEKFFLFMWFWFLLVAVATGVSIGVWFFHIVPHPSRAQYVKRHLRWSGKLEDEERSSEKATLRRHLRGSEEYPEDDKKTVSRFVHDYLRSDGVTILRLVQTNTSDIVASELTAELFDNFKNNPPTSHKKLEGGEEEEIL